MSLCYQGVAHSKKHCKLAATVGKLTITVATWGGCILVSVTSLLI